MALAGAWNGRDVRTGQIGSPRPRRQERQLSGSPHLEDAVSTPHRPIGFVDEAVYSKSHFRTSLRTSIGRAEFNHDSMPDGADDWARLIGGLCGMLSVLTGERRRHRATGNVEGAS